MAMHVSIIYCDGGDCSKKIDDRRVDDDGGAVKSKRKTQTNKHTERRFKIHMRTTIIQFI